MRDERFDRIVSSDLSRAYETAITIRSDGEVLRDPRWREFDFGEWEGLTWDEIVAGWPDLARSVATSAKDYNPPGGETFDSVRQRIGQALAEYAESDSEHVLVVTHAGPLHAMLHEYFGQREAEMHAALGVRFTPAGITRVEVANGRAELLLLNDITHVIRAEWE